MRALNVREVRRLAGVFRLCLCFAVVGITILGAPENAAAASATGRLPEIKVFSAEPLTLKDGGFALYKFEVWDAAKIQVIEAGEVIKEINGPASTTNKGTAKGRTTYGIRTGGSNTFDTILVASNASGKQEKKLTISFETKLQPKTVPPIPPVPDGQTNAKARTPKWGPQTSASAPLIPLTTSPASNWPPQFAKCPTGCDNCLKPDEAASRGLTKKCLEQPCYYSPDDQQKWYCYSAPEKGWCCRDGKVIEATKEQCAQMGGITWYASQAEALRACQPPTVYWCCRNGQVVQTTAPGTGCYTTQAEAQKNCQPPTVYWCCRNGQVVQTTAPGTGCYTTQAEAQKNCQPPTVYWCCRNGQVVQTTTPGTGCYTSREQAIAACRVVPPPLK